MSDSVTTTDHKVIKKWAEERAGQPATVRATEEDGHAGILRIDSGPMEGQLEEIEWAEFFASSTSPVSRFCIKTGAALAPPAYEPTATFPVRIENGEIQVRDSRWD